MENLDILINELTKLPHETSWVEFKHNNFDPDMIGETISALSNSATYYNKDKAYMIWGVDDVTHEIVGTNKKLCDIRVGNQEIENWLHSLLSSNCTFEFYETYMNNLTVIVLIILKATYQTVTFKKVEYIRVGSYTKKLMDHPSMRAQLWDRLRNSNFEESVCLKDLSKHDIINYLDMSVYFVLKGIPIPTNQDTILDYYIEEGIISKQDNNLYSITNLGAILFGNKLSEFPHVSRKAVRIIQYKGNNKLEILKEYTGKKGYAIGFESMLEYVEALVPSQEVIDGAIRRTVSLYPKVALREIIANALIHQDFAITGSGPVIELFGNRIEVTNPGVPLVNINRIVDSPPRSRNEKLASLMRQLRMCEELGSGWDRIVISCESEFLPSPKVEVKTDNTSIVMFHERNFIDISQDDRVWSCYLHACIRYISGETLSNSSLRERFGLDEKGSAPISRLIKSTIEMGLIKPVDPATAPRHMRYIPAWA